jgi:diguanylate cyclase (GGDEF)-like protein
MFFKVFKKKEIWLLLFAIAAFSGLCLSLLHSINQQNGNAKVVNYVGLVRGATQKLVKEELLQQPDDELIERLDTIIEELIEGGSVHDLIVLDDIHFQGSMKMIQASWNTLKTQINVVRSERSDSSLYKLYDLSQKYFEQVNETVFKAEEYSENQVEGTRKMLMACYAFFMAFLVVGLIYFIYMETVRQHVNKLNTLAYYDDRSALPNHAKCEDTCKEYNKKRPNDLLTVFMFDMNNLEKVNKEYGHQAGDKIIRDFSTNLQQWARTARGFVGRYGGDEFLGIVPNTDEAKASTLAEQFKVLIDAYNAQQSEELLHISYNAGHHTASLGKSPELTVESMLNQADRAMYEQRRKTQEAKQFSNAVMWAASTHTSSDKT